MPIEIQCTSCQRKLKVDDKFAGKKAKCPNCQTIMTVSGAPSTEVPAKIAESTNTGKEEWFLQTDDGEQYGPVTKAEFDAWVDEGRIDATCQVLCEGWGQWKRAEEVYPQLADGTQAATVELSPDTPTAQAPTSSSVSTNPFQSPMTSMLAAVTARGEVDRDALTPRAMDALLETRPWVLFISILLFIGCGFSVLGCLAMLLAVLFASDGIQTLMNGFMGLIMVVVTVVYGYAASYLFSYASRIGAYRGTRNALDLEAAIVAQKSFWKLVGIAMALIIGLYVLLFAVMLVAGVSGALR